MRFCMAYKAQQQGGFIPAYTAQLKALCDVEDAHKAVKAYREKA